MTELKIVKASEPLRIRTVSALIYGEPGIGKTTLALTSPNPLLIDCDGGVKRVAPILRGDFVPVENWNDILAVTKVEVPYDTVIIDTAGKALEYLMDALIMQNEKLENRAGYCKPFDRLSRMPDSMEYRDSRKDSPSYPSRLQVRSCRAA